MTSNRADDIRAIEALISRQFASMTWNAGEAGDWETFSKDFHPDATLFPAARPARKQTVDAFVSRMAELAGTRLRSFTETVLDTKVHVFGNIAVAVAGCEITENDSEINRGVEMLLLVRSEGAWRIVSQAWDTEATRLPGDSGDSSP